MATVYAERVIEIAVIQDFAGRPAVNVWHMYNDSEMWSNNPTAAVEDFRNNWQDHILLIQSSWVTLQEFRWRSLDPSDSRLGTVLPDSGKRTEGAVTGNPAPPNVAYLVKKNTTNRPRGARDGRCFLVGVEEDAVQPNGWLDPTDLQTFDNALQDFYDGISDSSIDWSGDSYPVVLETTAASRAPGTQAVTVNSRRVTSLTMDPRCSTQRDRLR